MQSQQNTHRWHWDLQISTSCNAPISVSGRKMKTGSRDFKTEGETSSNFR